MIRVKKNHLKLSKKEFQFLKYLCHNSKNLYNSGLYAARQHFFNCGKFLDYVQTYKHLKDSDVYKSLPSDPAQQTLKVVERSFRSFFGLLQKKKKGNYNRPVKIPGYLDKQGFFPLFFPVRPGCMKDGFAIRVPKHLQDKFGFKMFRVTKPDYIKGKKIKEVRIIPRQKGGYYEIEWVYEEVETKTQFRQDRIVSIDIGVSNFATLVDSKSGRSIILDGRELKSYNRFCNKKSSRKQAGSKSKLKLWSKRTRKLNDAMNQYVNFVLQYCLHNEVYKVVVGEGYLAQEGSNLGPTNNQNFVQLPFGKFCQKLEGKLQAYGIVFETIPEPYTSKCDHFAGEAMCHHEKYLGKRVKRGLFKSSAGILLNADVNGAVGILLKSSGKSISDVDLGQLACRGCLTQPRRVRLSSIRSSSSIRLVKVLTNQATGL